MIVASGGMNIALRRARKIVPEAIGLIRARAYPAGIDMRSVRTVTSAMITTELRNCCAKGDRKSTRLNFSHVAISYAVFCLKKKNALTVKVRDQEHWLAALLSDC